MIHSAGIICMLKDINLHSGAEENERKRGNGKIQNN
jgi:hypothetical protein